MNILYLFTSLNIVTGWWCNGHMTTAMIAQLDLLKDSPSVLEKAKSILAPLDGIYTHGLANTFVGSACWADDVKVFGLSGMDSWHFIDQPYNQVGLLSTTASEEDIIWALDKVLNTLGKTKTPAFESSYMMRYLIHFLGDIHQPLHTTTLWNRNFLSSDAGGNLFKIIFDDNITELHALWDGGMGIMGDLIPRPLDTNSYLQIETWALWSMGNYTRDTLKDLLAEEDRLEWTRFNYHVAVDHAYKGIEENTRPSEEYLSSNWVIIMRQLALGGYRLADILRKLYS